MAKKSLGQHFLTSGVTISQMVAAGSLTKEDTVVEVGPGKGVLTEALLQTGAHVIAIEKDTDLIPLLTEKFRGYKNFKLLHQDVLEYIPEGEYKVVANIPYYITGAIMKHFLEAKHQPTQMILLVQKEVADRIVARDEKESILSISVKAFSTPKKIAKVSRKAFNPPPKVDSAVINLMDIHTPFKDTTEREWFFSVLKAGFAHKRKVLVKNLEAIASREKITTLDLEKNIRAEDLKIEDWFKLSSLLK